MIFNLSVRCNRHRTKTLLPGLLMIFATGVLPMSAQANKQPLQLEQTLQLALQNDLWREANESQRLALIADSKVSGSLADPQLSLSMNNLPADNLSLSKEPMTQIRLAVSQQFERGDSRALRRQGLLMQSQLNPIQLALRQAELRQEVTLLWLAALKAKLSLKLIEQDQLVLQQLLEVSQASYASALGKSRQQDVIEIQLELSQLQDKVFTQQQAYQSASAKLAQHLWPNKQSLNAKSLPMQIDIDLTIPTLKPAVSMTKEQLSASLAPWFELLTSHPSAQLLAQAYQVELNNTKLAKQQYKPKWAVNGSYGYRQDDSDGMTRSDFLSVGISFDLPLFIGNKQDQAVKATKLRAASIETQRRLLVQNMAAQAQALWQQVEVLQKRLDWYRNQLLPQTQDQRELMLSAYTHDDGTFSDVMRARATELNTRILKLGIEIELLSLTAKLNYFVNHAYQSVEG